MTDEPTKDVSSPAVIDFDTIEALKTDECLKLLGVEKVEKCVRLLLKDAAANKDVIDAQLRAEEDTNAMKTQLVHYRRRAEVAEAELFDLKPKAAEIEARYLQVLENIKHVKRKLGEKVTA